MKTITYESVLIVLGLVSVKGQIPDERLMPSRQTVEQSESLCREIAKEPFFEQEMIVGRPWRVYYVWNMMLDDKCIDIHFKLATPEIIRRIYYDMNDYIEEQPAWGAASLLLTMGKSKREMLLFADQGPAGKFLAVPNVVRDASLGPGKSMVPMLKFQMKMIHNGRFLVFMDCQVGVASLAARYDEIPFRTEIIAAAQTLSPILGEGRSACLQDKNSNEDVQVEAIRNK